jgi:hypothetical protein
MYNDSLSEFSRILSEVEGGYPPAPELLQILADFKRDELDLLAFAKTVSWPFIEMQWFLYDNDELVYLPSDGDLWDIPNVVVVLPAPEIGEWKRLMTGSDLEFPKRNQNGHESKLYIDADGLFQVLNFAASFLAEKWAEALASATEKVQGRIHGPTTEPLHAVAAGTATKRERLSEELNPAPSVQPVDHSPGSSSRDSSMKTLLDRITDLQHLVASTSAAQQLALNRIATSSRQAAEESLRREMGDELFEDLSPRARHEAIAAEYCWLDVNAPDPSKVVASLGTAFEVQLKERIFERFCKALLAKGTHPVGRTI